MVIPAVAINEKDETEIHVEDGGESNDSTPGTSTKLSDGEGVTPDEREDSITLSEWREGPHQVIERRTGSTGEVRIPLHCCLSGILIGCFPAQVEVEVRRNVYAPENAKRMTSRFSGEEPEVRNAVSDYLHSLKEGARKHAEGIADDLRSAEVEIKQRLSPMMLNRTLDSQLVESPAESAEEDERASDNNNTRVSRPTKPKSLGGKTTRSQKHRGPLKARPSTAETPNTSREHSRAWGDRSSTPSPQRHSQQRGTGVPVSRTTSWDLTSSYRPPTDSRRGSIRNLRIDSLRLSGMPGTPRELSPARSVRFANSHRPRSSLPGTPTRELSPARSVRFADSHQPRPPLPSQDTSQSGSGDKDQDSSRNSKVVFELPVYKQ